MTGPPVSLLLPNYNNEGLLGVVLDCLVANTSYPNLEVVVVDDGSTDGSREILRRFRDSGAFGGEVRLIEKANSGVTDSLNMGLSAASGEICVQVDSDATVETPGWVERMLELLLVDERVGVVTGKVVFDGGLLHACGVNVVAPAGFHDRPSKLLEPVGRRRWHHRFERIPAGGGGDAERLPAEVDAACGCCMMYRRADALAAGGFDTGYAPLWFEDVDLSLALRRLDRKTFYLPEVRVVHYVGSRRRRRERRRYHPARVARAAARRLPGGARGRLEYALPVDLDGHFNREQLTRLRRHYRYWRRKWGWDPRNPDMAEVQRRWGGTEICWATDPERRAAGEGILQSLASARSSASS
jgi:GT2 family glycosyltransferase